MNQYLLIVLDDNGNEYTNAIDIERNANIHFNFDNFQSAIRGYELIKEYRQDLSVKIIRR